MPAPGPFVWTEAGGCVSGSRYAIARSVVTPSPMLLAQADEVIK